MKLQLIQATSYVQPCQADTFENVEAIAQDEQNTVIHRYVELRGHDTEIERKSTLPVRP